MKILIFGLGSVGKKHIRAIQTILPHAEIFAIRSNKDSESMIGVKNINALDEIKSIAFDFAVISNPTSEHKITISQLIEFKFPLFIEKPLYSSLDIKELIYKINFNRVSTYVACNLRFLDSLKFVYELLSQKQNRKLNEVNVYCGSYLPDWRSGVDFRKTYSAVKSLGGGVHLDLIHELDYLYWFFGIPVQVNRSFKSQSSLNIESFDYANYLIDYGGFYANVVLNYYRKDAKRILELIFEDETWIVDLLRNQVTCNGEIRYASFQSVGDTYNAQMQYFIRCVEDNEIAFNTVDDAFNVLKICLGE